MAGSSDGWERRLLLAPAGERASAPVLKVLPEGDEQVRSVRWDDVRELFDPTQNGTLPDLVVPDTTVADWDGLLGLIRSEGWRCEYEFGEEPQPLPSAAADLFGPNPGGFVRKLWIWPVPGPEWVIRPWTSDEIVGDVSLYEIQGQDGLDTFCRFMRTVGTALGKRVLIFAEGADEAPPMIAYEPSGDRLVQGWTT